MRRRRRSGAGRGRLDWRGLRVDGFQLGWICLLRTLHVTEGGLFLCSFSSMLFFLQTIGLGLHFVSLYALCVSLKEFFFH